MIKLIKKLFCKHEYMEFFTTNGRCRGYLMCEKCYKVKEDGREIDETKHNK